MNDYLESELLDGFGEFEDEGLSYEAFGLDEGLDEDEDFGEFEDEDFGEYEDLDEDEDFGGGNFELYGGLDAESASVLMEMLADQAASAESEEQADQFLPILAALAPIAAKLAPSVIRAGRKLLPKIARGVVKAGRTLVRSPAGKAALRAVPQIARGVARDVLTQHARGRPVGMQTISRSAARRTIPFLRDPRRRARAMHRCRRVAQRARSRIRTVQRAG